jgi:hypothetical protein
LWHLLQCCRRSSFIAQCVCVEWICRTCPGECVENPRVSNVARGGSRVGAAVSHTVYVDPGNSDGFHTNADGVALAPKGVHYECRKHTFGVRFGTAVGDMAHHCRQSWDEAASTCTLRPLFLGSRDFSPIPPERGTPRTQPKISAEPKIWIQLVSAKQATKKVEKVWCRESLPQAKPSQNPHESTFFRCAP